MVQPVKILAFAIVMIVYLWVPISTISKQERILSKGETFQFRPQPVDPYDAFRGKFIWLNIPDPEFKIEKEPRLEIGQKVYAHLQRDTAGYAYFSGYTTNRPSGNAYLQTYVSGTTENSLWLEVPESLSKYYLNEKLAAVAEEKYNELLSRNRDEKKEAGVVVDVKVYQGRALIEKLYFDGQEAEKYLRLQ